jgi:hypothetical protein
MEAINSTFGRLVRKMTTGWTREQVFALLAFIFTLLQWGGVEPADVEGWIKDAGNEIVDLLHAQVPHANPAPEPPATPEHPSPPSD